MASQSGREDNESDDEQFNATKTNLGDDEMDYDESEEDDYWVDDDVNDDDDLQSKKREQLPLSYFSGSDSADEDSVNLRREDPEDRLWTTDEDDIEEESQKKVGGARQRAAKNKTKELKIAESSKPGAPDADISSVPEESCTASAPEDENGPCAPEASEIEKGQGPAAVSQGSAVQGVLATQIRSEFLKWKGS
ncbi:histone chaperone ASF1-like [Mizuhopecten yessoensis]|uniref:histone chaperone ASF1-like n=1 Tax=Mizuhopecten yessoensis TaxID=6573 RepID=UPI000B458691|nr:histone chaperone ASF1-like [Mizuhopecten yessoensis]